MDSLEEFEFRPITDGLGFHKKAEKKAGENKPAQKSADVIQPRAIERSSPELPSIEIGFEPAAENKKSLLEKKVAEIPFDFKSTTAGNDLFSQPLLPREKTASAEPSREETSVPKFYAPKFNAPRYSKPSDKKAKNNEIQKEVNINAFLDNVQVNDTATATAKISAPAAKIELIECGPSLLSMFLDFTVIAGLSILFTLALIIATKIDMTPVLSGITSDSGTQIGLLLLVYSVAQLYLVLSRSFFGQTLGEWSLDTQLGNFEDQMKLSYSFKLIARTLLLTVTGMILLPLLSLVMGEDLTGKVCGLKLYRR